MTDQQPPALVQLNSYMTVLVVHDSWRVVNHQADELINQYAKLGYRVINYQQSFVQGKGWVISALMYADPAPVCEVQP
ncbi:MAG: hypothetical protein KF716_15075 [Anaerolineae bacterium]|nr:hypothetical protein [Anaerolineae bacterium]